MRSQAWRAAAATLLPVVAPALTALCVCPPAGAQPTVDEIAPPLPVVVPSASDWQPKFPFPFDKTRAMVTQSDIDAERDMCQWYTAQYDALVTQIDRFHNALVQANGDYTVSGNSELADAVAANIDRAENFLAPRAESLTISRDSAGDDYFPLYQGESFYRLWQHLSNVSAGITGRQPAWFVGPSLQRVMRWGSRIHRSGVCV